MNEAIRQVTHVQNIRYDKATERLYIIDQTLLPNEEKEIELRTVEEMIEAIKMLRIRGAPAIGICAAGQEPAEHQNACRKHRAKAIRHAREHITQALWSFFIAHPPEDAVFFMGTL